jgi:hypothetical protein
MKQKFSEVITKVEKNEIDIQKL